MEIEITTTTTTRVKVHIVPNDKGQSSFHKSERKFSDENRPSSSSLNTDDLMPEEFKKKDSLAACAAFLTEMKQDTTVVVFKKVDSLSQPKIGCHKPKALKLSHDDLSTFDEEDLDLKAESEQNASGLSNLKVKTDEDVTETNIHDQTMLENTVENKKGKLNQLDGKGLVTYCFREKKTEVAVSNEDGNCCECLKNTKDTNNCDQTLDIEREMGVEHAPVSSCGHNNDMPDMIKSSFAINDDKPDAMGHLNDGDDETIKSQQPSLVKSKPSAQVSDNDATGLNDKHENRGLQTHEHNNVMIDAIGHVDDTGHAEEEPKQPNLFKSSLSPVAGDSLPTSLYSECSWDIQESFKPSDLKPVIDISEGEVCHNYTTTPHIQTFRKTLETNQTIDIKQNVRYSINDSQSQIQSATAEPATWYNAGHSSETVREDDKKSPKKATKKPDMINPDPCSKCVVTKEKSTTLQKSQISNLAKDETCIEKKSQQGTMTWYKTTLCQKLLVVFITICSEDDRQMLCGMQRMVKCRDRVIASCPELCSAEKVKMFDASSAVFRPEKNVYSACNVTPTECPNSESDKRNHILCLNQFRSPKCHQGNYFCDKTADGVLVEGCFEDSVCVKGSTNRATFDRITLQAGLECQVCPDGLLQRVDHDNRKEFRPGCESRSVSAYIRDNANIMKLVQKGNKSEPDQYICDTSQGYSNRFGFTLCSTDAECECKKGVKCVEDRPELLPNGTCDAPCAVPRDKWNDFSCSQYKIQEDDSHLTTESHKDTSQVTRTPVSDDDDDDDDDGDTGNVLSPSTPVMQDPNTDPQEGNYNNLGVYIALVVVGVVLVCVAICVTVYCIKGNRSRSKDSTTDSKTDSSDDSTDIEKGPPPANQNQSKPTEQKQVSGSTTIIRCENFYKVKNGNVTLKTVRSRENGHAYDGDDSSIEADGDRDKCPDMNKRPDTKKRPATGKRPATAKPPATAKHQDEMEMDEKEPLLDQDGGERDPEETGVKEVYSPSLPTNTADSQHPSTSEPDQTYRKEVYSPSLPTNTADSQHPSTSEPDQTYRKTVYESTLPQNTDGGATGTGKPKATATVKPYNATGVPEQKMQTLK